MLRALQRRGWVLLVAIVVTTACAYLVASKRGETYAAESTAVVSASDTPQSVLTPDQAVLAVAEPTVDQVALLDTKDWSIATRIVVPGASRLALAPHGRRLLVSYRAVSGNETESGIAIIDLADPAAPPSRIPTGTGPHDIAIDAEGRFAFVSNAGADSVSVIDLAARQIAHTVQAGHRPTAHPLESRDLLAAPDVHLARACTRSRRISGSRRA